MLALVAMQEDGSPVVRFLPIMHAPPADAMEIPAAIKLRLRLDGERSWIVLTESNRFAWPGPDIRPLDTESDYYGPLPPALFAAVKRRFVAMRQGKRTGARHAPRNR